jgi:cholera toxin transcriptional activator
MPSQQPDRQFRFGVFEADTATGELRKSGVLLRLQEQSFQVLKVLLENQGQVVTREEHCARSSGQMALSSTLTTV